MIQHAQHIIDQLQYDSDLTRMTGSPTDKPNEIHIGQRGLELIDINEIIG
jgi:hypothetical protein